MRTTPLAILAMVVAAPLAAQSQQKVVILDNDTLVTIERTDQRSSCTVKIGDRTLSDRDAEPICARRQRGIEFDRLELETARLRLGEGRLRTLSDSLASMVEGIRLRSGTMASDLAAQSLVLRDQARALVEQNAARSALFDNLSRVASQGSIIGVSIDVRPRDTDRWGAYVAAVTPNYPADKAGIQVGDIITSINGQSMTTGTTGRNPSPNESLVWLRLSEVVRKLEPGKEVELVYRRDGRSVTTRITPIEESRWFATVGRPNQPPSLWRGGDGNGFEMVLPNHPGQPAISFSRNGQLFIGNQALAQLELAPVNEALGSYFGTDRGVLVLSVPDDNPLTLQPGDVVTLVDGRTVDTPNELIRVLRTYGDDKEFTLQVMRKHQRQSITAKLP